MRTRLHLTSFRREQKEKNETEERRSKECEGIKNERKYEKQGHESELCLLDCLYSIHTHVFSPFVH